MPVERLQRLAAHRVQPRQRLDLVAPELDPQRLVGVGRPDLHGVAAHAEGAAPQVPDGPLVLDLHQLAQRGVAVERRAPLEQQHHAVVGLGRAQPVDAGDAGHDQHVAPLEQRARRRVAHAVDLLVDRRFLLDVGVRLRDVGLGLVVVVVGNEVLHRVVGKQPAELLVELGGERLVVGQHQRGPLGALDQVGDGEGLARAGHAEQHLVALSRPQTSAQGLHGGRLIAGQLVVRYQLEMRHVGDPARL